MISNSAPRPMASMAITEATPNRIPSEVSPARTLLWPTASNAVRRLKTTCPMICVRSPAIVSLNEAMAVSPA